MPFVPRPGSGGGGGGGSFVPNPNDWTALDGVVGVGTGTALTTAAFPDLNSVDSGQVLASLTALSSGALRVRAQTANSTWQGLSLGTSSAGVDRCVAVRVVPYAAGVNYTSSRDWGIGIAVWDDAVASGNNLLRGVGGSSTPNGDGLFSRTSTAGRGTALSTVQTYSVVKSGQPLDLIACKDGSTGTTTHWIGLPGGLMQLNSSAWAPGDSLFSLMVRGATASLTVGFDVTHIGDFAQATPPLVT